jgi:hypothetical protein
MDSMLDSDAPTSEICAQRPAFPQQTYDARYPGKALPIGPGLRDMRTKPAQVADRVRADNARLAAQEASLKGYYGLADYGGQNGLMGPDLLAALAFNPDRQGDGKRMQLPAIAAAPEGVDNMFTRKHMVLRPEQGDRVVYRGLYALNERPPIRPVTGVAGLWDGAPVQEADPVVIPASVLPAGNPSTATLVGMGLVALGAYLYFTRKPKK